MTGEAGISVEVYQFGSRSWALPTKEVCDSEEWERTTDLGRVMVRKGAQSCEKFELPGTGHHSGSVNVCIAQAWLEIPETHPVPRHSIFSRMEVAPPRSVQAAYVS